MLKLLSPATECMQFITALYATKVETHRKIAAQGFSQGSLDAEDPLTEKIVRAARVVWLPTLQEIRALPRSRDYRERALCKNVENVWQTFGNRLGLEEPTEERRRSEEVRPQLPRIWPSRQGCRWRDCLCSEDAHPPHRMRVCKGCWKVFYCSTNCQKR